MAHGLNSVLRRTHGVSAPKAEVKGSGGIGSRRIFAPHFKLQVLDSYRNDVDCKGNQRATARKYGIHRRQIQKWLQCEANLRNSIGGGRMKAGPKRNEMEDAPAQTKSSPTHEIERGVLPISPPRSPLDYTMHSRSIGSSPPPTVPDLTAPIDLSLKRVAIDCLTRPCTPDRGRNYEMPIKTFNCSPPTPPHRTPSTSPTHQCLEAAPPTTPPHIWDLSMRREKRHLDTIADKPKPKLFKPYLDDEKEEKGVQVPPCCSHLQPIPDGEAYFNNNHLAPDHSFTVYELQPKSTLHYFYPLSRPCAVECDAYYNAYDGLLPLSAPLRQRHTYSLDFKLRAIESYYQDNVCKGNQRAVASKYNIHRRQVQKWLKQEEELRQRNDAHAHAVR